MTRGGHIFYVEIDGDATHNPQVIMSVVDMMDKLNMGYGSVNHNRNRCMDCGYENAAPHLEKCPKCGSTNIDKLQRITGYLVGTTDRWNHGKLCEFQRSCDTYRGLSAAEPVLNDLCIRHCRRHHGRWSGIPDLYLLCRLPSCVSRLS